MSTQYNYLQPSEIYSDTIKSFNEKYSWLGEQFAKELLHVIATNTIQYFFKFKTRVRDHLLLFWEPGKGKTTLMREAQLILSEDLSFIMQDLTKAAFRGSLESVSKSEVQFVPPECAIRRFIFVNEIGKITKSQEAAELHQLLLSALEEGQMSVSLVKLVKLNEDQRNAISRAYDIKFDTRNPANMRYNVNSSFIISTYDKKYLLDDAFISRFKVMIPIRKFDNDLISIITQNTSVDAVDKPILDQHLLTSLRHIIETKPGPIIMDQIINIWRSNLPKIVYEFLDERNITLDLRLVRDLKSYMSALVFWQQEITDELLISKLKYMIKVKKILRTTLEDEIVNILAQHKLNNKSLTYKEILNNLSSLRINVEGNEEAVKSILSKSYRIQKVYVNGTLYYTV
jgi:hypothetical protein